MTPSPPEAPSISAARKWAITFTVMVVAFMQILDTSVANVILPHLQGTLSAVLDASLGDALCGTKLLAAHDYKRFVRWREDFGDFDPFGDFELLFPAAILGLGIVDIPIRYRARTYGQTNIQRFRHGYELLKMTAIGLSKVKVGKT